MTGREGGRGQVRLAGRDWHRGSVLGWLGALVLGLAGCAQEVPPGPPHARGVGGVVPDNGASEVLGTVTGRVALSRLGLAPAEVLFVPEGTARPFLEARLAEAMTEADRIRQLRAGVHARHQRLLAEVDRTNVAWKMANESELRRRLAAQVRPTGGAAGVLESQRTLLAEKQAAWTLAQAAALRSDEGERQLLALQAQARRYRQGDFYLQGLPPAAGSVRADQEGRFTLRLPPGSYAVAASVEPPASAGREPLVWLLWLTVEAGREVALELSEGNLHGTDCAGCAVEVAGLPP